MNKPRLSSSQLADILLFLIGDIKPTGDTFVDHDRLCNLLKLQAAMDIILDEMSYICSYSESDSFSVQSNGGTAYNWFKEKRDWINGILEEYNEHSN